MRRTTRPAFWDLARDHFGTHTPLTAYETIGQVLRAVIDGPATIGVLPLPAGGRPRPLVAAAAQQRAAARPRVFARLPFGDTRQHARGPEVEALAIGRVVPEEPPATTAACWCWRRCRS